MFLAIPQYGLPIYAIPAFSVPFSTIIVTQTGVLVFEAFQANGSFIYSLEVSAGVSENLDVKTIIITQSLDVFSGTTPASETASSDIYQSQLETGFTTGG